MIIIGLNEVPDLVTAIVPTFRTVQVERTTTVNKTSRPERKLMALAYIQKNGYLSVGKYCGFTDREFREICQRDIAVQNEEDRGI